MKLILKAWLALAIVAGLGHVDAAFAQQGPVGNAAPVQANQIAGRDKDEKLRAPRMGSNGGFLPGQALATSTLVTTVASTSTQALAASATRILLEVQIETTLTADLYICLGGQTCSATVHDRMVASGAAKGTLVTLAFGSTGAVTYYTTQAGATHNFTSWTPQ